MRVKVIDSLETPASSYPRKKLGVAEIKTARYTEGVYDCYGVGGFAYYKTIKPLKVAVLKIKGKIWMVDDPPHWWAMQEHAQHYSGVVICAGLWLGLIVHALHANPKVTRITVIEREQDVIDLVRPLLPKGKVEILHGDFWDMDGFYTLTGKMPDGVFYDLFVGKGKELQPAAMRVWFELHERFPGTVRRIHGFNNEQFQSLDALIEKL
jgi:hypothetical protein